MIAPATRLSSPQRSRTAAGAGPATMLDRAANASTEPVAPGLQMPAPGTLIPLVTESIAHRAELAAIELGEARTHAFDFTLLAGATGLLLLLAGFALTLTVAALVWDSPHRGWWLVSLCAAYLASAGATGWTLRQRLRGWQPFEATLTQIQLDHQCLTNLLKSFGR